MTGFATFAYSKKYFVSQEIEFIPESEIDPEFGEGYKAPQDLIRLLADNVGIGTTNIIAARQELDVYGTAIVSMYAASKSKMSFHQGTTSSTSKPKFNCLITI